MRVLFTTLPAYGGFQPLAPVARALAEAEAAEKAARVAYQTIRGAQKFRADRIKTQRQELARAGAAIASVRRLREKEATERSTLAVA
jgi:hypothetical protein